MYLVKMLYDKRIIPTKGKGFYSYLPSNSYFLTKYKKTNQLK
jgi:hypothetical protein